VLLLPALLAAPALASTRSSARAILHSTRPL